MEPMENPQTLARSTEERQNTQVFTCGKTKYEAKLTSSHLQWRVKEREHGEGDWSSCEIRLLVGCALVESKDNPAQSNILSIYYTSKDLQTEIWTCEELLLEHEDNDTLKEWNIQVNQKIQECAKRPRSLLVFVNPASGDKKGQQTYEQQVAPLFEKAAIRTHVHVTKSEADIPVTINGFDLKTVDGIATVGGDGTFNMVLNALLRRHASDNGIDLDNPEELARNKSEIPIGIIPCGSGQRMVLATYGTIDVTTAALHILTGGILNKHSLAVHNGKKFGIYASFYCGYGGLADTAIFAEAHREFGRWRYIPAILKMIYDHTLKHVEISYLPTKITQSEEGANEGVSDVPIQQASASGWRSFTGRFRDVDVAISVDRENQRFTDDIFVETVNESVGRWQRCKSLRTVIPLLGNEYGSDNFSCYHCKEVQMTLKDFDPSSKEEILNIDGQIFVITDPVLNFRVQNFNFKTYGHGSTKYAERFGQWNKDTGRDSVK